MMHVFTIFVCSGLATGVAWAEGSWGYEGDTGPSHWFEDYPVCNANSQSPINIVSTATEFDQNLASLVVDSSNADLAVTVSNNGHTMVYSNDGASAPKLSGDGLDGEYQLRQFHLHWSGDSSEGSEHTVDGAQYPLEIHFVHWNTKYASFEDAVTKSDGLAVVGVFFNEESGASNTWESELSNTNRPANIIHKDECSGECTTNSSPWDDWFNGLVDFTKFYRYQGSLTTPPCTENVIWTVMKEPVSISAQALTNLRALRQGTVGSPEENDPIAPNFRPTQDLNGRVVYRSFE